MRLFLFCALSFILITVREQKDAGYGFDKGDTAAQRKEYKEAIKYFTKGLKLNPLDTDAYYNRGLAKYKLEKFDDAIADFTKVIELNPKDADAYGNRGAAKNELGKYE